MRYNLLRDVFIVPFYRYDKNNMNTKDIGI